MKNIILLGFLMFTCLAGFGQEICSNGIDDDNDNLVDCDDPDCKANLFQNPSMELYPVCPGYSTASTIDSAAGWKSESVTNQGGNSAGQLMVNDTFGVGASGIPCISPRPAQSWSNSNNLPGGSDGVAWLGLHSLRNPGNPGFDEVAQNTLAVPTVPGNTYSFTFEATYTDNPGDFPNGGGYLYFYGIRPGDQDFVDTVRLGRVGPINNKLQWQTYAVTFTAHQVYDRICLAAWGDRTYIYFDNFVAAPCISNASGIPTVSEWGLLILGLLILCWGAIWLRRAKRRTSIKAEPNAS